MMTTQATWVVWIDGVETDYYMTKKQAEQTAQSWKEAGYDKVVIEDTRHNCLEAEWRWLECDKCDVCDIRVCVECGAEVGA